MHHYCAIEDEIDMITIAFTTNDSQRDLDCMLELLEYIRFPHPQHSILSSYIGKSISHL
jgi:hypothetical protein